MRTAFSVPCQVEPLKLLQNHEVFGQSTLQSQLPWASPPKTKTKNLRGVPCKGLASKHSMTSKNSNLLQVQKKTNIQ